MKDLENVLTQSEGLSVSQIKPKLNEIIQKINEDLNNTDACGAHQKLVIDSVLKLSRLEKGKHQLEKLSFDLVDLLKEAIHISVGALQQKNLEFKLNHHLDRLLVKGDKTLIKQVVINLISNSIKFTNQGRIELGLQCLAANNTYEISITDTGIGMTLKEQHRLFKPYVQANANISSVYGGSGLGLAISKQIVELMGGKIKVQSEKGIGSTFSFTLELEPLSLEEEQEFKSKLTSPVSPVIKPLYFGKTVLIVEDNAINRRILTKQLEENGFVCEIAADGQEGVNAFAKRISENRRYDAIFMDIQMPIMNGLTATKAIREKEQQLTLPATPIICLTGNARDAHEQTAKQAGMDDFLTKPYTIQNVLKILHKWLAKQAKETEQTTAVPAKLVP